MGIFPGMSTEESQPDPFGDVDSPAQPDDVMMGVDLADGEVPCLQNPVASAPPSMEPSELKFESFAPATPGHTMGTEGSSLLEGGDKEDFTQASKFSIAYYKQFFDVDTDDVKSRILKSLKPLSDQFVEHVAPN